MSQFYDAAKEDMLTALGITQVSLHTDDPGNSGANEVTGGTPAYSRENITWAAASGSSMVSSNMPVFDVPACTVTHIGYWAGAVFYASDSLTTPEVFAAQGTLTLDSAILAIRDPDYYA